MEAIENKAKRYLCECGCGLYTEWSVQQQRWRRVCTGHTSPSKPMPDAEPAPLCLCNCGGRVVWSRENHQWNKYIHHHYSRTQEHKDKCREALNSPGMREKLSARNTERLLAMWQNPEYRAKELERMKEMRKRNRIDPAKNKIQDQKSSERMKEMWQNKEFREMRIECSRRQMLERWSNPEYKARQIEILKSHWKNKEYRDNQSRLISERMKKLWANDEYHAKQSKMFAARWQDKEYVQKMMDGYNRKPNKLEILFDSLTTDNIHFVGDGSFWRTWTSGKNKNPDYLVYDKEGNPTKLIVELLGDYWHKGDDVQLHTEMWNRLGYECLIIWEHQVHEEQEAVLDLVSNFVGFDARA